MDPEIASATILPFLKQTRFADVLLAWRRASGKSQAQLATALGVRPQTVSAWERGTLKPQARFHPRLATLLGLDGPDAIADLVQGRATATTAEATEALRSDDLTETQRDVLHAIAAQMRSGRELSESDHELARRMLGAVGL